jgi:hypothetical protein
MRREPLYVLDLNGGYRFHQNVSTRQCGKSSKTA